MFKLTLCLTVKLLQITNTWPKHSPRSEGKRDTLRKWHYKAAFSKTNESYRYRKILWCHSNPLDVKKTREVPIITSCAFKSTMTICIFHCSSSAHKNNGTIKNLKTNMCWQSSNNEDAYQVQEWLPVSNIVWELKTFVICSWARSNYINRTELRSYYVLQQSETVSSIIRMCLR